MMGGGTLKELFELLKKYWIGMILCFVIILVFNFLFGTVCYTTLLFGIPCPACGITRATVLMLTGHFRESFQMHPLLFLVILGIISYPFIKKRLTNYVFFVKLYVIMSIVVFVGFYIYRMKMYYPNVEPLVYRQDNFFHNMIWNMNQYNLLK